MYCLFIHKVSMLIIIWECLAIISCCLTIDVILWFDTEGNVSFFSQFHIDTHYIYNHGRKLFIYDIQENKCRERRPTLMYFQVCKDWKWYCIVYNDIYQTFVTFVNVPIDKTLNWQSGSLFAIWLPIVTRCTRYNVLWSNWIEA